MEIVTTETGARARVRARRDGGHGRSSRRLIERLRLDTERLSARAVHHAAANGQILASGRISHTTGRMNLAAVCVVEESAAGDGRGDRAGADPAFPAGRGVSSSTDQTAEYYERLGFLRTEILPDELDGQARRVPARGSGDRDAVGMIYDRMIERMPTIADVYRAKHVIEQKLPRTPLLHSPALSRELGFEAYVKLESLQPIGAFKVRGGVYLAATLSERGEGARDHRRLDGEPRAVAGVRGEAGRRAVHHRDAGGGEPAEGGVDASAGR